MIANKLAYQAEWLGSRLSPIFDKAIRRSVSKMTVEPESNKAIKLNYTVNNPKIRTDLESKMLDMANAERMKVGLEPLKADPELVQVARAHSRDVCKRIFFARNSGW
jgi:uncharacterized protein YkwD